MADTQRTRAALQTLLADNVTGDISPQDLRDFLVTVMQPEFVNANDFWCEPLPDQMDTDLTTRGWHLYSQEVAPDMSLSFGKVYALNTSNVWSTANPSEISMNATLGAAADSYASGATTAKMLRRGIIYNSRSSHVDRISENIGLPLYLMSLASVGYYSITNNDFSRIVGTVLPNGVGYSRCGGKVYFNPDAWSITGA
jgi:hypothetical protein